MNQLLLDFSLVITTHTHKTETSPGPKFIERYEFVFIDGSRLATYESRKGIKFKYSYQWLTDANQTIYRWDNTPHFPATVMSGRKKLQSRSRSFH